jgi:hypothetical protein
MYVVIKNYLTIKLIIIIIIIPFIFHRQTIGKSIGTDSYINQKLFISTRTENLTE